MSTLLPPNATAAERAIEAAIARIGDVPVPIRALWNPSSCPVELLPYLAWAFSVDVWDASWPEYRQRAAIAASFDLHKHKGTRQAVENAVAAIGGSVVLREWFEQSPLGTPGTFQAVIATGGATVTAEFQNQIIDAIERSKPVSRHFSVGVGIDLLEEVSVNCIVRFGTFTRLELEI